MPVPSPSAHLLARSGVAISVTVLLLAALVVYGGAFLRAASRSADHGSTSITVDYPEDGSLFPPEITSPTFLWRDGEASAKAWRIDITFADGSETIHVKTQGDRMRVGEIDPRCISDTNQPPSLTPEQAVAHTWTPNATLWATIKQHSAERPATILIVGFSNTRQDS